MILNISRKDYFTVRASSLGKCSSLGCVQKALKKLIINATGTCHSTSSAEGNYQNTLTLTSGIHNLENLGLAVQTQKTALCK